MILGGKLFFFFFPVSLHKVHKYSDTIVSSYQIKEIRVGGLEKFLITSGSASKDFFHDEDKYVFHHHLHREAPRSQGTSLLSFRRCKPHGCGQISLLQMRD